MFRRNTRKTFGQNVRKTPVRCKKYGTVSADGNAIIKTKSVFVETHFFTIEFCQNQGKNVISSV